MFVTTPSFEQAMPKNLVVPGQRFWQAVTLSLESPWFLFTYTVDYDGVKQAQSTAVAWESTLVDLVRSVEPSARRKVFRLAKEQESASAWQMQALKELWIPSKAEEALTGMLLFQLEGESVLRDLHLDPVLPAEGRSLLFCEADTPGS